jgi:N-succinyldiaminopimelate aminotransferase
MPSQRLPYLTSRLQGFGTTVFAEMTELAVLHNALNLGQGFPNFDGPDFVKEAAVEAIRGGGNQYCRMSGMAKLNRAIARHQKDFYDLDYDPDTEVTVMNGATEAICVTLQALLETGDEVVFFEPFYDSYRATVAMAGGVERLVTLRASAPPNEPRAHRFSYDSEALERVVTAKTRVILLNSPHNPTGKVFARAELEHIAHLSRERDLLVVADEVYEHMVYDGEHIPISTLPGMRERTLTISSAGKTFSFTGWKVGWACAPRALTTAIRTAHQFTTFCNSAPLQGAIARALDESDDSFYRQLTAEYRERRDHLCDGLEAVGFAVLRPAGTYFALADIRPLGYDDDVVFCRMLPESVGVGAIPPTAFYVNKEEGRHLVRFAFCKTLEMLDEAVRRLHKLPKRA